MVRFARNAALVAFVLALFMQGNAQAITHYQVAIADFSFTPSTVNPKLHSYVTWTNNGPSVHTATSDSTNPDGSTGIALWDSGDISVGSQYSFLIIAAGKFPYYCTIHTAMTGTVSVGVQIQPPSGPVGTTFTIRVGTGTAPQGFAYDIQMAQPGGSFQDWMTGITQNAVTWTPTAQGTYKFRSRYRKLSNNGASLYSASKSVVVT
jgi:plastocyanin